MLAIKSLQELHSHTTNVNREGSYQNYFRGTEENLIHNSLSPKRDPNSVPPQCKQQH